MHLTAVRIINTFLFNSHNHGILVEPAPLDPVPMIGPIDGPLWYVRDLMVMVIVSPVIYWLIKNCKMWFVAAAGVLWFISSLLFSYDSVASMWASQLLTALFFFSWGAFFSANKSNIVLSFRRFNYAPLAYLVIAIVDLFTKGMEYHGYIHKAGILLGIISAIVCASYLLDTGKVKVNQTLANCSFFIFALHGIFLQDFGKIVFSVLHIQESNPYAMLGLYFAVPVMNILICISLYLSLKRFAPKLCNLLTGGR